MDFLKQLGELIIRGFLKDLSEIHKNTFSLIFEADIYIYLIKSRILILKKNIHINIIYNNHIRLNV